jgi:hypothetical protein
MSNDVAISIKDVHQQKWLEVILPLQKEEEFALLTILNHIGEHVLKMELTGSKHRIELTYLKLENGSIKIETAHSVIMQKIK